MSNKLTVITQKLKSKEVTNRIVMGLGFQMGDEKGMQEAYRYAASALAEIEKTAGDPKRDLTICTPESIAQAVIDASRFKFMIDGRQLAHIVKYGDKATLQIGYRGYIAKISEHYKSVDYAVGAIYEGDTLEINDEDGFQHYKVTKEDPFMEDPAKLKGVYVALSYKKEGRKFQKITVLSKKEIDKIKSKAKQDFIWNEWFIQKAIVAAIKRSSKIHFATIQGLQELIRYDNHENFDMDKAKEVKGAGSIIENLNADLLKDEKEIPEAEIVEEQEQPKGETINN